MMKFNSYKVIKLKEIAEIERAQEQVIYRKGCSTIQISATKGEIGFLDFDSFVSSKNVVIIPNETIIPKYLNFILQKNISEFMTKYKCGLNIKKNDINEIEIELHDIETQKVVISLIENTDREIEEAKKELELFEKSKLYFLDEMFV